MSEETGTSQHPLYQACLREINQRTEKLIENYPLAIHKAVRVKIDGLKKEGEDSTWRLELKDNELYVDDSLLSTYWPWSLAYAIDNWDRIEEALREVHQETEKRMMRGLGLKNNENGTTAWDRLGAEEGP